MTELHDLVAPYALDALDGDEMRLFEAHLETCHECQAELVEMREQAAELAFAASVGPPSSVKQAVMAAIDTRGSSDTRASSKVVQLDSRRRGRLAWTIATAAAVVALVFFGLWTVTNNQLSQAAQIASVYEAPDAQLIELESTHGPVRFVYSESLGDGVLNGGQLVELDPDDVYEVWLIGSDGPLAAGTLDAGETSVLVDGISPGLVLAMTVEPAPGVDAPTSDPILATEL